MYKRQLYFQYNQVGSAPEGESLADFFGRLLAALEEPGVGRLVIDVRQNPGGASHLSRPLIEGLRGSEKLDPPGRLFVLLGPGTGSAAVQFVFALEKCTHAIFAGEPSGQGPIFYSDPLTYVLPHTGIALRLSTTHWVMSFEGDGRDALEPDLPAPLTLDDLRAGRDPALEAVLAFDPGEASEVIERVRGRRDPVCRLQYYGRPPKGSAARGR